MFKVSGKLCHRRFPRVSERRMPHVVTEGDGFRQILIETKPPGNRPSDLRDFQTVGHARPIVIAGHDVDLRLMLHAAKRLRMQDAVPIALISGAKGAEIQRSLPFRFPALRRVRR